MKEGLLLINPVSVVWILLLLGAVAAFVLVASRLRKPVRRYEGPASVSWIYDQWTGDQILEHYWGGHLHAGYYGDPPAKKDFITAKNDLVDEMLKWGLAVAPRDLMSRLDGMDRAGDGDLVRILDVGCGLGGTIRRLAARWPETTQLTGITLSEAQAKRAAEITDSVGIENADYLVCDASFQAFPTASFDIVWALEVEVHMPDKAQFTQEMVRMLKPGGVLIMGTWNVRDSTEVPLTRSETEDVQFLIDEWAHAAFSSIPRSVGLWRAEDLCDVMSADWTVQTVPTWRQAITQPFRKPGVLLQALPHRFSSVWRDGFTILRYDRAFRQGLMSYGLFRGRKAEE